MSFFYGQPRALGMPTPNRNAVAPTTAQPMGQPSAMLQKSARPMIQGDRVIIPGARFSVPLNSELGAKVQQEQQQIPQQPIQRERPNITLAQLQRDAPINRIPQAVQQTLAMRQQVYGGGYGGFPSPYMAGGHGMPPYPAMGYGMGGYGFMPPPVNSYSPLMGGGYGGMGGGYGFAPQLMAAMMRMPFYGQ